MTFGEDAVKELNNYIRNRLQFRNKIEIEAEVNSRNNVL